MLSNFERTLKLYLVLLNALIGGLCAVIGLKLSLSVWLTVTLAIAIFASFQWISNQVLHRFVGIFKRANIQLEAMQQADFTHQINPHFQAGHIARFERELVALSECMHQQKSLYTSHMLIIYQLIDKLPSPIWVFDENETLNYANPAFSLIYQKPWQDERGRTAETLGLFAVDNQWCFSSDRLNAQWSLTSSEFYEQGKRYRLVIATDIRRALRHQELAAWQQLIRVISHEIHNTLTPVSSLAQTLQGKVSVARDAHALKVIEQRCVHLQQFVSRFSELSKPLELHCRKVELHDLLISVKALIGQMYDDQIIQLDCTVRDCRCDPQLFEQVLINLLKNAAEANLSHTPTGSIIGLSAHYQAGHVVISITDQGGGFANLDNVMTPFYSTKSTGQGIGLTLSRRIIEQHDGSMIVSNGLQGAEVKITLPS
ncbi:PAS domain-containing sensor histidine kinase [Pseudoalteromonas luteoviolacea]|uniref:sensor histidine kinase n=1 Tax=Pseudoalteromonas luteoviolacea TaxID=43657 RepID=UPI001F463001|nr:PAS domain-containing sensor histidine kinase [Pseudoalteromonas luteoviolacea]MCF6441620.1 PAS domain-containing sensor histidine kinase [Pseudoalteromonas luteoviolacea]